MIEVIKTLAGKNLKNEEEHYANWNKQEPDNKTPLIYITYIYCITQQFEKAMNHCQLMESQGLYFENHFLKGKCLLIQKKYQQARQELEKAKENASSDDEKFLVQIELNKIKAAAENKFITLKIEDLEVNRKKHKINFMNKILYRWYQTPNKVGIEIDYQLKNKNLLNCNFSPNKVIIEFPTEKEPFNLTLNLYSQINPDECQTVVHLNKIQILLEKKDKGTSWKKLNIDEIDIQEAMHYPSSSKNQKDWNKFSKQVEHQINTHKQEYGIDPLMNMFQQIFSNGTQEQRKAMNKSMQTSGGTVLSTNWDEVKMKDYSSKDRPQAPKGQQWKIWDK